MKTILYTTIILITLLFNSLCFSQHNYSKFFIVSTYPHTSPNTYPYIYGILDELRFLKISSVIRFASIYKNNEKITSKFLNQRIFNIFNQIKDSYPDFIILIGNEASLKLYKKCSSLFNTFTIGTTKEFYGIQEQYDISTFLKVLNKMDFAFSNIYILEDFTSKSTYRSISQNTFFTLKKFSTFSTKKYIIENEKDLETTIKKLSVRQNGIILNLLPYSDLEFKDITCKISYLLRKHILVCFDNVLCKKGCIICISPDKYNEGKMLVDTFVYPVITQKNIQEHNKIVTSHIYVNKKFLDYSWLRNFYKFFNVYKIEVEIECPDSYKLFRKYLK